MRGGMFAVAERRVEAARLGSRWRRRGGMRRRVIGRARVVALGANNGIGGIGRHMSPGGTDCDPPWLRWMRSAYHVAGGTGLGARSSGEIFAVAELAGDQAPTNLRGVDQLGAQTMDGWISKPRRALVVAPAGQARGHRAANLQNGNLVALHAGIDSRDCLSTMGSHPARGMIVPVILGNRRRRCFPATAKENRKAEDHSENTKMLPGPLFPHPGIGRQPKLTPWRQNY